MASGGQDFETTVEIPSNPEALKLNGLSNPSLQLTPLQRESYPLGVAVGPGQWTYPRVQDSTTREAEASKRLGTEDGFRFPPDVRVPHRLAPLERVVGVLILKPENGPVWPIRGCRRLP